MTASRPPGSRNTKPGVVRTPASVAPVRIVRKGRGATYNIAHRYESVEREVDGDELDRLAAERAAERTRDVDAPPSSPGDAAEDAPLPPLETQVGIEHCRSILAWNDSPDIGFDRSINPYRGCEHGCIYCYARPTHSYLNLSPGIDFETRLSAKVNAAEVLRRELSAPGYRPATINIGSITDAYQPVEREMKLTRAVIEVLHEARHPLTIVTKSNLVERDLDLLAGMARDCLAAVFVSVTTLDHALSRKLEPRAASPARRLRTIETLARAGVPVEVNFSPVIPFVNEPELERVVEAAANAGARYAWYTVLRLPWEVAPLFRDWLAVHYPQRAERVMHRVQDMRGGRDYDAAFSSRMKGEGAWAKLIAQRMAAARARHGLARGALTLRTDLFRPPGVGGQLSMF